MVDKIWKEYPALNPPIILSMVLSNLIAVIYYNAPTEEEANDLIISSVKYGKKANKAGEVICIEKPSREEEPTTT